MENVTRRQFVIQCSRVLAFIPLAGVISCTGEIKLSAHESLKRLIFIIGPWPETDQSMAEDFADRFLETPFAEPYLPKSVSLVQSLYKQMTKETTAVMEIDIARLPAEEQEILVALSKQLYSFVEVRFYISNEPPWGQCQGNPKWHTRIPK